MLRVVRQGLSILVAEIDMGTPILLAAEVARLEAGLTAEQESEVLQTARSWFGIS